MSTTDFSAIYEGAGTRREERAHWLADKDAFTALDNPAHYLASDELRDAVNVSLELGQPLLVTGDPGTGKTRLAASIAWELGLELLPFHTKTTSTAEDLFYAYDALRRFQDVQMREKKPIETYIICRALGTAILLSNPTDLARRILPREYQDVDRPLRSVVLIDEIDKAPRDLPNDVLNEVEQMRFEIRETEWPPFAADPAYRPIVILTSNSEKNLPDAFLRRCVFYHIELPAGDALKRIVMKRFEDHPDYQPVFTEPFVEAAVSHFEAIRGLSLKKKPATAEFLAWLSIVKALGIDLTAPMADQPNKLEMSYPVLAKNKDDLAMMKRHLKTTVSAGNR
jgi:MoxR-like ATPase